MTVRRRPGSQFAECNVEGPIAFVDGSVMNLSGNGIARACTYFD